MRQSLPRFTLAPERLEISDYSISLGLLTQADHRTMSIVMFYPQIPKMKLHRVNYFNFLTFLMRVFNH